MVNYNNGKIYKLVCGDLVYIGSTTQLLCKRLTGHRVVYKRYKNGVKTHTISSFKLFEYADINGLNVDIVLIEKYPCEDKSELHRRERYWIENTVCVNKNIPTRTDKEYRKQNKVKLKEYFKEYREQNKDKLKEYVEKNKDKLKEYFKEYREQNKDKLKEYRREYYKEYREQNKDKLKEYRREYYKEYYNKNKDKIL